MRDKLYMFHLESPRRHSPMTIQEQMRIAFSDFCGNPLDSNLGYLRYIAEKIPVEFVEFDQADILIYSDFGTRHQSFRGLKVYITGENMLPDFNECDLAFTPHESPDEPRAFRLPFYAQVLGGHGSLVRPQGYDARVHLNRTKFCSFVVSNPRSPERNRFFRRLNRAKPVDSAGRHFNNTGQRVRDKQSFLLDYRMNLAFENTRSDGYITEKLVEPLLAGCVPIYWGAPDIARDFNPGCMINVADFPDFDSAIEHILAVDANPEARLAILNAPVFKDNIEPACMAPSYVADPIIRLINSGTKPGRRSYRQRRLREHVYGSPLKQSWVSLKCRLDSIAWRTGLRR
jgi:hypothetical protein